MNNAMYIGLSRQMVLRRAMDVVANNIANADTSGFKVEDLMSRTEAAKPARTADGPRPIKFAIDSGVARDFGQGTLRDTGGKLDFAIEGDGFFTVRTAAGPRYTRDGRFTLDTEGRLVTQRGQPVLDEAGAEITLNPEEGEVSVSSDGVISQVDPTTGQARVVGRLGVVRFDNLAVLDKQGDNLLANTSNARPQAAGGSQVRQGMLEGSNVNSIVQITRMIEINRAYESASKLVSQTEELSRSAIERLGRVN